MGKFKEMRTIDEERSALPRRARSSDGVDDRNALPMCCLVCGWWTTEEGRWCGEIAGDDACICETCQKEADHEE